MTHYTVLPLVCFIALLSLGIFVLFHKPHTKGKILLSLLCFEAFYWQVVWFVSFFSTNPSYTDYLAKISYLTIVFLPFTFYHFIVSYLKLKQETKIVICFYGLGLFMAVLLPTDLFVAGHRHFAWGNFAAPGPLYPIYMVSALASMTRGVFVLNRAYKNPLSYGISKNQLRYIFIGLLLYYSCAIDFLPVYGATWYPIGSISFLGSFLVISYAIIWHQLMDIEVIIKKTLVFAGVAFFSLAVYSFVVFVFESILSGIGFNVLVSRILSAIIISLSVPKLYSWLTVKTDKFFFQKGYSYDEIQDEIASCSAITDLSELCKKLVEIFAREMALETTCLAIFNKEKNAFKIESFVGVSEVSKPYFSLDEEPLRSILENREVVVKAEEIAVKKTAPLNMESFLVFRPVVIVKINYQSELIALFSLGRKKSDKEFSNEDVRFLSSAAKQIANVINIAQKFHFERGFYALQAQENRIEAVAQLSVGLDHEIKNPLNQILPRLQLITNYYEQKKIRPNYDRLIEFIHACIGNVDRIVSIMTRLRKFANPISAEDLKLHPILVRPFVEEAVGLISTKQLEIDNIRIENLVPEDTCVFGEETSIIQVFYNLINNAYHAIDRNGTITIFAKENIQNGRVVLGVKDTGGGISQENLDKIFDPFFTTKPTNLPADGTGPRFRGTGLGLSFVKKYIEDLGGSVNVASEPGKGSTFFLRFLKAEAPHHAG